MNHKRVSQRKKSSKTKGNAKQAAKALTIPVNSGYKKLNKVANRTAKKVTRAAKKVGRVGAVAGAARGSKKAGMPKYNKKKK